MWYFNGIFQINMRLKCIVYQAVQKGNFDWKNRDDSFCNYRDMYLFFYRTWGTKRMWCIRNIGYIMWYIRNMWYTKNMWYIKNRYSITATALCIETYKV